MRFMIPRAVLAAILGTGAALGGGVLYQVQSAQAQGNQGQGGQIDGAQVQAHPAGSAPQIPPPATNPNPNPQRKIDVQPLAADRMAVLVRFSACMREHGVRDYPEPEAKAGVIGIQAAAPGGSTSTFRAATQACRSLLPPAAAPAHGRK